MLSIPKPTTTNRPQSDPAALVATLGSRVRGALHLHTPRFLRGSRLECRVFAPVLATNRLMLRPHRLLDAEAWYQIQSDPEVVRHLPWPVRDRAQSFEHLRHRTRHTCLEQSGDFLALAIEHEGALVGDVSLHLRHVEPRERSVEIGWLLATHATGRGLAAEAAIALIAFAFSVIRAQSVIAVIADDNVASQRLAARLGFAQLAHHHGRRTMELRRG